MKKRIISLLLCFVMLFTLFSVQAFAADQVRIEGENVTHKLNVGDVVEVPVNVTENPGFIIGKIRVSWDSTALKLTEVSYNGFVPSEMPAPITEGISSYAVPFGKSDATANYTQTGLLFTLKYEVLAGAAAKEYPITLTTENTFFQNFDVDDVASVTTNGSVTLTEPAPTTYTVTINPGANMTPATTITNTVTVGNGTDVSFTAADGYYFPNDYTVAAQNGVRVVRVNDTKISVTGTPTGDVNITLPDATAKPAATYNVKINLGVGISISSSVTGNSTQTVNAGAAIDPVVFEASDDYYFPTDYGYTEGDFTIAREGYTKIKVSGIPTNDVEFTLKDATKKATGPAAPDVGHTDCTTTENNDGTITGVNNNMEYRKGNESLWSQVTGSGGVIRNLVPGTYEVRYAATPTVKAGTSKTVVIKGYDPDVEMFTITFNPNGGKGDTKVVTVPKGSNYVIQNAAAYGITAQDGMRFVYWSNREDNGQGSEQYSAGYEYRNVQSNLTFYAVWDTTDRTVFLNAGEGGGDEISETVTYDQTYTLPGVPETFTAPNGKEFDCWKIQGDNTNTSYNPSDSYTIKGNVKFVAQWKDKQGGGEQQGYTLTFKPGDGSGDNYVVNGIDTLQYTLPDVPDTFTAPADKPNFDGWKAEGGNVVYPAGTVISVNADATFVAQWKADGPQGDKVIVNFKPGDGTGDAFEVSETAGKSFRLPAKPAGFKAPAGKVFAGWKIEDPQGNLNEKLYKAGHKFDLTGDVTFVAQWKTRPYYGDDTTTPDADPMVNPGTGAAPVGAPIAVVIAVAVAGAAYFVTTKKR